MAGILDKKERVIDYKITANGRSQIQNGDIRFVYATFSDSSIVYNELDKSLTDSKRRISDELNYLPFEVTSKVNDELNPEFDLTNFIKSSEDAFLRVDSAVNDLTFDNAIQEIKNSEEKNNNVSLSRKLLNLKYLDTQSNFEVEKISFVNQDDIDNKKSFTFYSNQTRYPTLYNSVQDYNELNTLIEDKRLSRKTNFKKLVPISSQNVALYDEDDYKRSFTDQPDEFYVVKDYNKIVNTITDEDSPEDAIAKTIKNFMTNPRLYKKEYSLKDFNKNDVFIFNMYEHSLTQEGNSNNNGENKKFSINKLSFIDLGEIFDKKEGKNKRIFLIGKIIKSRNENNIDIDLVFNFNDGVIQRNTINSQIPLSIYYSFINMFTLVLE